MAGGPTPAQRTCTTSPAPTNHRARVGCRTTRRPSRVEASGQALHRPLGRRARTRTRRPIVVASATVRGRRPPSASVASQAESTASSAAEHLGDHLGAARRAALAGQQRRRARWPSARAARLGCRCDVDPHAQPRRPGRVGRLDPFGQDPADFAAADQHVVGPLQHAPAAPAHAPRRPSATASPASSGSQVQRAGSHVVGRSSTDMAIPVPGGAVQVRPSRPRPADWWSVISTLPGRLAGAGPRGQIGVGRAGLGHQIDLLPQAGRPDQLTAQLGRSIGSASGTAATVLPSP